MKKIERLRAIVGDIKEILIDEIREILSTSFNGKYDIDGELTFIHYDDDGYAWSVDGLKIHVDEVQHHVILSYTFEGETYEVSIASLSIDYIFDIASYLTNKKCEKNG